MPNITVTVDEAVYRAARIAAAQRNASVSALVREYLQSLVPHSDHARAQALLTALDAVDGDQAYSASSRLSRDEVHGR